MTKTVLLLIVYLGFSQGTLFRFHTPHLDEHWKNFTALYNREFNSLTKYVRRLKWEDNVKKIVQHNQEALEGVHNYTLRINHLTDVSSLEYKNNFLGLFASGTRKLPGDLVGAPIDDLPVPKELDWRKEGFVTPPWNQKQCGACYAFSVVAAIQAQVYIKKKSLVDLSEQQVVDCSIVTGNLGCDGGSLRNTLRYLQVFGVMKDSDYPYKGKQGVCKYIASKVYAKVLYWAVLPSQNEEALKRAVAHIGPLPVSLDASRHTFQFYHSGLYNDPKCSNDTVNHAMLLVGYTEEAWILKNWWSSEWGDQGYMYLKRNENRCGVSNFAAYVTVLNF